MLINVVALEMLKAKMPQFSSRWLLFKRTDSLCPQPLSLYLAPVWQEVAKSC